MSMRKRQGRGSQAMALDGRSRSPALTALLVVVLVLAVGLGLACLVGVRKTNAMLESKQAQRAFEAVRRHAGPRMLVRTLEFTPRELRVWAMDPDTPPWRYVAGTRRSPSRTVHVSGVYEQSWRVTRWKVFSHDWYSVSGPEPEGIIEQDRGPAFDLQPGDIPDLAAVVKQARTTVTGDTAVQLVSITQDSRGMTVWLYSPKGGLASVKLDRHGG